ncbi:ABC transporter substrate-binding protein [Halorientalis halophila]|uniref:ABC transporter substrate-binding protein n=1 Tax=Halorientalis halophila TaxID=3108499 RepID=UPI0030080F9F
MVNDGNRDWSSSSNGNKNGKSENVGNKRRFGRRPFIKAAGIGAAATGLAGCLGGGGEEAAVPLADRDEIRIGVLAPHPSEDPIGGSIANGAKLAAKQINDDGGLDGTELNVMVKDTAEDPQTGRERYGEFIREEDVDLTTGVFTSEVLLAILEDIAEAQTPHMTAGAATPDASAQVNENYEQYKYHFRTGPINAHHLGVNLVDFMDAKASDLGWETVAVLVEDFTWTEPVSAVLNERLEDTGVDVVMNRRYSSGTSDFNPVYNDVEDSGADAAFVAMAHTGSAAITQWAQQQRPFEFGGIHVPMQLPAYYDLVKGASAYGVTQNSATPQSEVTTPDEVDRGDATVPFAENFMAEYDSYPVYTGYIAYDAVNQFATVVEEQGDLGADPVVTGLEESSYTGTAGTIEYYGQDSDYTHDVVYAEDKVWPVFMQWQPEDPQNPQAGGTQEVIFPDNLATADYQTPPWI